MKTLQTKLQQLENARLHQDIVFKHDQSCDLFNDHVENCDLPIVWVDQSATVLYCNKAMISMLGKSVVGKTASHYYDSVDEFDDVYKSLSQDGIIRGRIVTLKHDDGSPIRVRLFSNIHRDDKGTWINSRCIFVPNDL